MKFWTKLLHFSVYLFYITFFFKSSQVTFISVLILSPHPMWWKPSTEPNPRQAEWKSDTQHGRGSTSQYEQQCVLSMQACPLPSQGTSVTHSSGGNKVDLFQSVLKTYSVLHLQLEDNVHNNISSYWCDILCDSHDTTSIFCSYHLCLNVLLHIW